MRWRCSCSCCSCCCCLNLSAFNVCTEDFFFILRDCILHFFSRLGLLLDGFSCYVCVPRKPSYDELKLNSLESRRHRQKLSLWAPNITNTLQRWNASFCSLIQKVWFLVFKITMLWNSSKRIGDSFANYSMILCKKWTLNRWLKMEADINSLKIIKTKLNETSRNERKREYHAIRINVQTWLNWRLVRL